jgi:secreted trypsin-like serine protease
LLNLSKARNLQLILLISIIITSFPLLAIVGGEPVDFADHPSYVSVYKLGTGCGGAIIGKRSVLTAAHCIDNDFMKYGGVYFHVDGDPRPKKLGEIAQIIIHPQYTRTPVTKYDLAVIQMKEEINFSKTIKSIKLAGPSFQLRSDRPVTIIGLGKIEGNTNARQLMTAQINLLPQATDAKFWIEFLAGDKTSYLSTIKPYGASINLSYSASKVLGPCHGDSGGPQFIDHNGERYLVGIMSFIRGDCGYFSGYSSVPYFYNWIKTHI